MTLDNPPPIKFTPIEIPKPPAQEFNPIFPKRRDVTIQPNSLIITSHGVTNISAAEFHDGDFISATDGSFDMFCCPSEEARTLKQPCQDCMGIVRFEESDAQQSLLVVQADGVGGAYSSEIAAGVVVRAICENGTTDLQNNVTMAAERIKNFVTQLPAEDTPKLVLQALAANRTDYGTHTTVNQLLINSHDGNFSYLSLGDGELVLVRSDGSIIRYEKGTASSRLTSRRGMEGNTIFHQGTLGTGDTIYMFSDGLDKLDDVSLTKLTQLKDQQLRDAIDSMIPQLRDDDKGFFEYHQK